MSDERTRVEIGFDSGLIVVAKVTGAAWETLEQALATGSGSVRLDGEDATTYYVEVSKVSYVKHEQHVGRVGF